MAADAADRSALPRMVGATLAAAVLAAVAYAGYRSLGPENPSSTFRDLVFGQSFVPLGVAVVAVVAVVAAVLVVASERRPED